MYRACFRGYVLNFLCFIFCLILSANSLAIGKAPVSDVDAARNSVKRAIDKDDGVEIEKLFKGDSGDLIKINEDIGKGASYLHLAADKCQPKAVSALISLGANPNIHLNASAESPLSLAARRCATEPVSKAEETVRVLFNSGANPNAMHVGPITRKMEPEFFDFALLCNKDAVAIPSYLPILDIWIKEGLNAAISAEEAAGSVNLLHFWAGNARMPLCSSAIERVAQRAQLGAFAMKDVKGRLPIDFTFGPAVFTKKDNSYQIYCFTYSNEKSETGVRNILNALRIMYLDLGKNNSDVNRACAGQDPERMKPVVQQGMEDDGNVFLIQEIRLWPIDKKATTDDPECSSPPGGWSRCQVLRLEPFPGVYSLKNSTAKTWFKEDRAGNGQCLASFDPIKHKNMSQAGYRMCNGKCSAGWAAVYPMTDGISASGGYYTFVERLAKNWSDNKSRCYALTVDVGKP